MSAPSLNANPSPATPMHVPADGLTRDYARLLNAAYSIRKSDTDFTRLGEIERIVSFADSALADLSNVATTAGPPVPSVAGPQPQVAPPAAPTPVGPVAAAPAAAAGPSPSPGVAG